MIIDLPDTTVSKISRALVNVREEGGAVALGRVLTLIIAHPRGRDGGGHRGGQRRLAGAPDARHRAHDRRRDASRLPPGRADPRRRRRRRQRGRHAPRVRRGRRLQPREPRHRPAPARRPRRGVVAEQDARRARRRPRSAASPSGASRMPRPSPIRRPGSRRSASNHAPGDTDLAWTRLTHWREQLAAVLDQPPYEPVTAVEVRGAAASPSTALLAAWLRLMLDVPVDWRVSRPDDEWSEGIKSVRLTRASGDILLERSSPASPCLTQPGQPHARPRPPPPDPARVPRRGASPARSGRPVWSSDHRGLGALGTGDAGDAWLSSPSRSVS